MTRRLLVGAVLAACVPGQDELPAPQPTEVVVALPRPCAEQAVAVIHRVLPEAAVRIEAPARSLELARAAGQRVLFGFPEHVLRGLAAEGLLRSGPDAPPEGFTVPWCVPYGIVSAPAVPLADAVDLLELAIGAGGDLRLGLCGPEVDPGFWLGVMARETVGPRGADGGLAMWLALDARAAGSYEPTLAHVLAAVRARALDVAIVPAPVGEAAAAAGGLVFRPLRPADATLGWLGVGLRADGEPAAAAVAAFRALAALPATELELRPADVSPGQPRLGFDAATAALARFDATIRGQGRGIEQLDEWLDVGFGLLFVVFLVFVYFRLRRSEPNGFSQE